MSLREFKKLLDPIKRRVRLMVSRAVLTAISDGSGIQVVQVKLLDSEIRENVERMQNYGHTSVPPDGAEGIMVCVSGNRDHGVVIALDHRGHRVKGLAKGESAQYDDQGQIIHIKRDKILIQTPKDLELRAKNVKIHAEETFKFDVNGQGQKWDGQGVETWQEDDQPRPTHPHSPPEIL